MECVSACPAEDALEMRVFSRRPVSPVVIAIGTIITLDWLRSCDQSGDHDPQLGITKAGNVYLRTLLTEAQTGVATVSETRS
jgi:hypothetical protein